MTCAPLLPLDPSRSPVGFHPVESKLWEFVEPSGWREIPPLDFLIIFTIATHRFSYTFGAATFVNGLQLGYIRLYPDDPMPSSSTDTGSQPSDEPLPSVPNFTDVNFFRHDLTFGFFHGSYVPKFVQFSDHFPHFCPNFHVPIVFPSFFPTFSHHFPIIFHQFSTSFPPVFHHFGHLRGGRGLNAAIDACASAGETSQGWRLLRLAEGIPRGARDVSSLPWALARPRGMARRDGGIGSDQMRERETERERDVYVYIYR